MGKKIQNLTLIRSNAQEPFGFRIVGGKDEGVSFKVGKVVMGSPAEEAGLEVHDFLVTVQGKDVFDCTHAHVVNLIKQAGKSINISIERGDFIVPNFEEIWPSGKSKARTEVCDPAKGVNYVMSAMYEGVPGNRNGLFTTVGKPKVEVHQYDNPINCYSDDILKEMSEIGTWKRTVEGPTGSGNKPSTMQAKPIAPGFKPHNSAVVAALRPDGGSSYGR